MGRTVNFQNFPALTSDYKQHYCHLQCNRIMGEQKNTPRLLATEIIASSFCVIEARDANPIQDFNSKFLLCLVFV